MSGKSLNAWLSESLNCLVKTHGQTQPKRERLFLRNRGGMGKEKPAPKRGGA